MINEWARFLLTIPWNVLLCLSSVVYKMAYSQPGGASFVNSRIRSQSDSDLLAPKPDHNGVYSSGSLRRNTSMDEIASRGNKKRNFFYRLVRPWKWRKPKRGKSKDKLKGGDNSRGEFCMSSYVIGGDTGRHKLCSLLAP